MQRYNNNVQGPNGQAIVGAAVVVTAAANPAGTGAPAIVYSDDGLTQISNTLLTDALGRFGFYVPSGKYDLSFSGGSPLISQPYVLANVEITDHLEFKVLDTTPLAAEILNFTELPSGPTPPIGTINLYSKTADKLMYYKNDAGIEVGPLGSGSGGSPPAGSTGAIQTNNAGVFGAGPQVSTVAIKAQLPLDPIQYVSANGNDSNDGLSLGSAKLTVYAALQALPGGSVGTVGNGKVVLSGTVAYGGPLAPVGGMWLMSANDPNFTNPPIGWLKRGGGGLILDCIAGTLAAPHGHTVSCTMTGGGNTDNVHPAVWISGGAGNVVINNIAFGNFLNTYVKYGIDSNNNRSGTGGSSGFAMSNVSWNHGSGRLGGGPGLDIGSQSFWIWLKGLTVSGASPQVFTVAGATRASAITTITTSSTHNILFGDTVTLTNIPDDSFNGSFTVTGVPDNLHFTYANTGPNNSSSTGQVVTAGAAAINIDSGPTGAGSGLVFMDDINLNNGCIRLRPGNNGGSMYIRNVSYEGSGVPDPPIVLVTSVVTTGQGGGFAVRVDNVETSDTSIPVSVVQVDNATSFPDSVVVSRIAGPVRGQMVLLGGVFPTGPSTALSRGQFGLQQGQITATGIDVARRGFSPVLAPGTNLATTNPTGWTFNTGAGTITPGILAPDGTNNAGRVTGSGMAFVQFFGNTTNLNLGDVYVFGVWARAVNGQFVGNTNPIKFTFNSLGLGAGDTCAGYPGNPGGNGIILGNRTGGFISDGQWQWYSGICTVASNPTTPGTSFTGTVDSAHAVDFYAPVMMLFPAGTKSNNEVFEIANNLASFTGNTGEICMLPSQRFRPGTTTFANLGSPPNGVTFIGCSDCTVANPCGGGGTGALAKSLGGIWVCN
jgi:hypothetical protein